MADSPLGCIMCAYAEAYFPDVIEAAEIMCRIKKNSNQTKVLISDFFSHCIKCSQDTRQYIISVKTLIEPRIIYAWVESKRISLLDNFIFLRCDHKFLQNLSISICPLYECWRSIITPKSCHY